MGLTSLYKISERGEADGWMDELDGWTSRCCCCCCCCYVVPPPLSTKCGADALQFHGRGHTTTKPLNFPGSCKTVYTITCNDRRRPTHILERLARPPSQPDMTAATAPSPSPAPSAPPHAHTPTRQSPVDTTTRRHDASTSASPTKLTSTSASSSANYAASNLGTLAKPIDLASPPASPTLVATTAPDLVASPSTRLLHQPSPSPATTLPASASTSASAAAAQPRSNDASASASASVPRKGPPYVNALATPNRLLPPTPLGNANERAAAVASPSTASSTPSKSVQLPAPYKAPRLAQSGASESFATAYPTQETRQKYASPAKPLPSASGTALSHKRSWQSSGSVDLSNKKFRPTATGVPASSAPSSSSALAAPTASVSPSPFGTNAASALPTARASSASAAARPPVPAPSTSRPL